MNINKSFAIAGINGFGRFGLSLFRSWFEDQASPYKISFINDDELTINDIIRILKTDSIVTEFNHLSILQTKGVMRIQRPDGRTVQIHITKGPIHSAFWIGKPHLIFECSGRIKNFNKSRKLLISNTKHILVSAIAKTADSILIRGYNHTQYSPVEDKIISFGSCTVIPGIFVISFMHSNFEIQDCAVNIIHSVPKWQLEKGIRKTLSRKVCSLEKVVPQLINSINPQNIKVNYTYVPYYGASLIDFQFTLRKRINKTKLISLLLKELRFGRLKGIISLEENDSGPEPYLNSRFSVVLIKSSIDIRDNRVYFFGYFNNEGSGIRLHELASYIVNVLQQ